MRTRLLLATAVSLTMIGAGSYAVNHPGLFTAFAQDADVAASEPAPADTETVTTDSAETGTATETETAAETAEPTDTSADTVVDGETSDHGDHADADMQPGNGSTPEN